jgi:hypothetical protein
VDHVLEDSGVVGDDFGGCGALGHACLGTGGLELACAQGGGDDAIELGGLVEANEGVGIEPVAAGAVATVDEGDVDVSVVDERVDESEASGTGANDEVVGLNGTGRAVGEEGCGHGLMVVGFQRVILLMGCRWRRGWRCWAALFARIAGTGKWVKRATHGGDDV